MGGIGGLLPGLELDDLMMGISVCRNPHLANVFYRMQLIEAYGTGMKKIMGAYADTPVQPKVTTTNNAFKIILPNVNAVPKAAQTLLDVSQSTAGRILKAMVDSGQIKQF